MYIMENKKEKIVYRGDIGMLKIKPVKLRKNIQKMPARIDI